MGLGEVKNVDVVTDAGAVGRGIIHAKNGARFPLAENDFQEIGNEMGFDPVVFAKPGGGSAGIKIPKSDIIEPVNLVIPPEHVLENEL